MISPDGMEWSFRGLTMFVINFGVESLENRSHVKMFSWPPRAEDTDFFTTQSVQ